MMTSTLFCILTSGQDVIRTKPQSGIMTLKSLKNEKPGQVEISAMRHPTFRPAPPSLISSLLKRTIIRPALLLLLLLFSFFSVLAYDCKVGGICYNLNKTAKTASVTFYSEYGDSNKDAYKRNVIIPETISYDNNTYSVTSIGNSAFHKCSRLTSITIPNSVLSIGATVFYNCTGLTSVTIPNSVTSIGGQAFYGCSNLTSITIGSSITFVESNIFRGCTGLTFVAVSQDNNTYDSRDNCNAIIETCTNKLIFGCKNTTIPNSVTSIDDSAFRGCSGLTSVTIPSSVTSIGCYAFDGCSGLTSVTIPYSVTSIDKCAFGNCSKLASVIFNAENCTKIASSYYDDINIFTGCINLTSLTIGDKVSIIPDCAFSGCSRLTSVVVNKNNNTYDSRDDCNAIIESSTNKLVFGCKSAIIPISVSSIGYGAFYRCTGLTSVTIPNSITSIGTHAFDGCSSLTSVTIPNSVTSINESVFSNCSRLTSVTIPNSVSSIGRCAFYGCSMLTSLTIPNSVTSIDEFAFSGCIGITSVTIPNSVSFISAYSFNGCSGLTSLVVDKDNDTYDSRDNCNAIIKTSTNRLVVGCKNTTIPNSVSSIGSYAFSGCSGLTSVTIPNSVTSIGFGAFYNCSGLTSVTIPNSVTSIVRFAFFNCYRLTKLVSLAVEPPVCDDYVFEYVDKTACQLFVPEESVNKYKVASQWEKFLNISKYDGVDDVSVDTPDAVYEVYNLQGVRVGSGMHEAEVTADTLPHGVYILVSPQGRKKLKI